MLLPKIYQEKNKNLINPLCTVTFHLMLLNPTVKSEVADDRRL